MTGNMADREGTGLLHALGLVDPPGRGVLEAARAALWSAVAQEMLSMRPGDNTGRSRAPGTGLSHEERPRRQAEPGA